MDIWLVRKGVVVLNEHTYIRRQSAVFNQFTHMPKPSPLGKYEDWDDYVEDEDFSLIFHKKGYNPNQGSWNTDQSD